MVLACSNNLKFCISVLSDFCLESIHPSISIIIEIETLTKSEKDNDTKARVIHIWRVLSVIRPLL